MTIAQIGPVTSAGEATAAAVAAGILLGSFAFGTIAFLRGASREALEARVLTDGYAGGSAGLFATVVDLLIL